MKIFGTNSLSSILYYLIRLGFWFISGLLLLILISLSLGFITYWFEWNNSFVALTMADKFSLHIKPMDFFINAELGVSIIIPILVFTTAAFYAIALYFLTRLFKNFRSSTIFKNEVVASLNGLTVSFLIASLLSFCMMYFSPHSDSDFLAASLLLVFALILFFIKEIFRKGVIIQEEQNLTI